MVYTSATFSLALLEIMVNTSSPYVPADMVYAPIDIPDRLRRTRLDIAALPKNWFASLAPVECQLAGDSWVRRGDTVALLVPSGVARIESNVLLNPAHPDFTRLTIGDVAPLDIDNRLIR